MDLKESVFDPRGYVRYVPAGKAGIDSVTLEGMIRDELRKLPFVADVFFRRDLADNGTDGGRQDLDAFRRSYSPDRSPDFVIHFKQEYLLGGGGYGANHSQGCMHVPLVVWGNGLGPQSVARLVRSVDIAPTLARMMHIEAPEWVDGRVLEEAVYGH
jgi:hypothetical protein